MTETLIVPGLNGSPAGHWQHHWLESDPRAALVEQSDWAEPVQADWLHALEAAIMASRPGVILVAHSLGCALVAALAGRPAASHVGGALLVAPADLGALARTVPSVAPFADTVGARLPFASILVASRNDPYMSFDGARRCAATWGSALFDLGEAGHVNIASGFGPWPDAETLAGGLRGRPAVVPRPRGRALPTRRPRPLPRMETPGTGIGLG
ncbi:alpha/beta hydrolase [Aureimonas flava]|uniref:Alpha/beta hydrolase n=1 Tax=Aureimonas flava TaxID=2320271 RepID=A0A3A1WJJ3_9HYPH|nr:alpha/beta hydrolase [Aureimonas flava]RIY00080.1 alpha/beta hydrolase [Aureimonas flava]